MHDHVYNFSSTKLRYFPGDNLGRSERDEAVDVEEAGAGGGCDFAGLGGIGAAIVPTTEVGVF